MEFDFYKTKKRDIINNLQLKFFDQIEDVLFILAISADNDYDIPYISDSAYEMFEISSDKIFNDTIAVVYDRIHQDDKIIVKQSLMESIKNKKKWNTDFKAHLPIKGLRWFDVSSKRDVNSDGSMVLYGRITDISEIKAQEQRLKFSEERFNFALETFNTGIWDWDLDTNKIVYSAQSIKILELPSTEIINSPEDFNESIHTDDIEKYHSYLKDVMDNKTSFYEYYHRVLKSNNKYKWILNRGKVIEFDAEGKPLKIIGTYTDVSFEKEKELELTKKIEFYSKKNNRLLNFSHIVSHNLNSHAGNFKQLLDLIDLEENFAEKRETMKYLRTVSNDLNKTIEDLSQIVNIENDTDIRVEPLILNNYLSRVLNVVSAYGYKNNATIINNIASEATINFNPAYLESILQNLCTNAIKYADPNKFLIIEFDFFIENGKKVLTVKDNGLGIDLEKYGHLLFGMYKTFHKHEKANGIGLYITKNQIESMNGSVTVESQVGKGTIFKIVFND